MCAQRTAVLLPPSRNKLADGCRDQSVSYAQSLTGSGLLADSRRVVLGALLASHMTLSPQAKMRLYGVNKAGLLVADQQIAQLSDAPTRPARERYRGVAYTNAGLSNRSNDHPDVRVLIVSALLGLADLDTPVPNYRLEFGARLPNVGSLSQYWAEACTNYLMQQLAGVDVWNLLPNQHSRILDGCAEQLNLIDVQFLTPSGKRANTARTKAAKGHMVAALRREGALDCTAFAALDPLAPDWTFTADGNTLTGVCHL